MSSDIISYRPTEGLCYDPKRDAYWDPELLARETTRIFEVCHGCRMCFKYCDSFPILFDLIEGHGDDVRQITADETDRVIDACFQCKLCEVQCPYTPREQHEFQLDFPRLVHRHRAVRARRRGLSMRDRALGRPDGVARLARMSLGLANRLNRVAIHRWLLEKVLGIHRDKALPRFASRTFDAWATAHGHTRDTPGGETVLFATCFVNNNDPEIGRDTLEVLAHNQVECSCATGAGCCGMPAWEAGDLDGLRRHAKVLLDRLTPFVEAGSKVVVLQPTCAMLLRREYPELIDDARAEALAAAVVDPGEYLWSIRKEERFNTDFQSKVPGGVVAYHTPCHLRAQAVGFRGRDLMRKIGDLKIQTVMECCGHDGTYAMKVEGFEASVRTGQAAFDGMQGAEARIWVSECGLASLQFQQHAGRRAMHPMSVLARAYRPGGFDELPEVR